MGGDHRADPGLEALTMPAESQDGLGGLPAADLGEVHGLGSARRAVEIAAAGGHPLLLVGQSGSGKTLLASSSRWASGTIPNHHRRFGDRVLEFQDIR